MTNEESRWIAGAQEGDHRAFRSLYDLHVAHLYRFLRQFSPRTDQVEEWVQRAFIKAFEHVKDFNGRSRFSTWLFRLGLNEMNMDQRRGTIVRMMPLDEEEGSPQDAEAEFEWQDAMRSWMYELDAMKRAVFILYEIEGYSHAEIARMLNIGESTSRTLLSRAKHYLRERWRKETKER